MIRALRSVLNSVRDWNSRRDVRRGRPVVHPEPGLPDTTLERVAVSYEPCRDGDPDPGEVVWAWVHYEEDLRQGKDRPVVIIGRQGDALAGVQLTTNPHDDPRNVAVGPGSWDAERRDSWARVDRVVRIDPATVRRTDFVLDRHRFDAVLAGLRRAGPVR